MNQEEPNKQAINQNIIHLAQHLLQQNFLTPCKIKSVIFLSEPERRNVVLR